MEMVQPIRNKKHIDGMKRALKNDRDKLLFIFGINSGLRISDILKLKVGDVRGKLSLTLRETKTGKSKTFRYNQSIKEAVKLYVSDVASDSDYIFQSRKGDNKPLTRVQAYRILNEAAEKVGITEQIGCHSLRKTAGYWAYNNGVDITVLMHMFNHSSQSVTLRYIGITQDHVDEALELINL